MIIKKKNRNHSVIRCKFRKECLNLSDSQREKVTIKTASKKANKLGNSFLGKKE